MKMKRGIVMKMEFRSVLSVALIAALAMSCSLLVFAAKITAAQAEDIALADAGLTRAEVTMTPTEVDYENGRQVYEIEFFAPNGAGYIEYDYEVWADSGAIRSKSSEFENGRIPGGQSGNGGTTTPVAAPTDIGAQAAKDQALAAFGLSASDVQLLKLVKDYEDGVQVYDVEYRKGLEVKYSCEVDARTGAVTEMEIEHCITIGDKIELLFDIIEEFFRSLVSAR